MKVLNYMFLSCFGETNSLGKHIFSSIKLILTPCMYKATCSIMHIRYTTRVCIIYTCNLIWVYDSAIRSHSQQTAHLHMAKAIIYSGFFFFFFFFFFFTINEKRIQTQILFYMRIRIQYHLAIKFLIYVKVQ